MPHRLAHNTALHRTPSQRTIRIVLDHQQTLQAQLKTLTSSVNNDTSKASIRYQVSAIQRNVDGISEYLSSTLPTVLYNEHRQRFSTTASRALSIPEILELVLVHTHALHILNVSATCSELNAIIDASPKLQTALFFRPAGEPKHTATNYKFHPLVGVARFIHLEVDTGPHWSIDDLDIIIELCAQSACHGLPSVGENFQKMQISQPPIYRMNFAVKCGECYFDETDNIGWAQDENELVNTTGLTFEDLYDQANEIFRTKVRPPCSDVPGSPLIAIFKAYNPWKEDEESEDESSGEDEETDQEGDEDQE